MMNTKNDITDSCGKRRGCIITLLPSDSRVGIIVSRMHGASNDIQKILSMAYVSLDEKLEKEGPMEKMAA